MKRFLILAIFAAVLVLAFVGCGSETDNKGGQGDSATETTVSSTTTESSATTDSSAQDEPAVDCEHVCGEWEYIIAPSCLTKGKQKTTCTLCGDEIISEAPAKGHTPMVVEGKEPSCSMVGLTQGEKCTACGRMLVEQKIIEKLPHTEETVEGTEPTCSEVGLSESRKCTVCGMVTAAPTETEKLPHTEEVILGYGATCTEKGLSDGKKCTVCGEVTVAQAEISSLGHKYVSGFCSLCKEEDPDATHEPDQNITIATGGASDYVVVYDDRDVRAFEFAQKFVNYMLDAHRITLESAPYSGGDYGKHCIFVGDLPEAGRVRARLNSYNDFGACVVGDDYVMYATDSRLYEYLFEVMKEKVLYTIRSGNWSTNASRNLIYHDTDLKDKSYVDYVIEKNGGKLTQDVLLKLFEARTFVAQDGTELAYRLYVPYGYDETKEYPVVLFMHGAGERGSDNLGNMKHMPLNWFSLEDSPFWNAIVIAPQCPNGQQWVDTPWSEGGYRVEDVPVSNEITAVMEILDMVEKSFPTDLDRYYVTGLSMGGFATWDIIMRYTERFAAAVPLCGGGDYKQAYKLVDMPIYTIHDRKDATVPFSGTKEMVVALEMLGSTVINYEEVTGYGHNVWNYASTKASIWEWLFGQTKEGR